MTSELFYKNEKHHVKVVLPYTDRQVFPQSVSLQGN